MVPTESVQRKLPYWLNSVGGAKHAAKIAATGGQAPLERTCKAYCPVCKRVHYESWRVSESAGPVHCDSTQSAEATASMVAHSARAGQTAKLRCSRLPNHRRIHRRSAPQPQRAPLPARRTYVTIANTSVLRSATHADHGVPHAFHCDESVFTVTAT